MIGVEKVAPRLRAMRATPASNVAAPPIRPLRSQPSSRLAASTRAGHAGIRNSAAVALAYPAGSRSRPSLNMLSPSSPPVRISTTAAITERARTQSAITAVPAPARWCHRANSTNTTRYSERAVRAVPGGALGVGPGDGQEAPEGEGEQEADGDQDRLRDLAQVDRDAWSRRAPAAPGSPARRGTSPSGAGPPRWQLQTITTRITTKHGMATGAPMKERPRSVSRCEAAGLDWRSGATLVTCWARWCTGSPYLWCLWPSWSRSFCSSSRATSPRSTTAAPRSKESRSRAGPPAARSARRPLSAGPRCRGDGRR